MELTYDRDANTLRLTPAQDGDSATPSKTAMLDALLDIGEGGRLIGIEFQTNGSGLAHWQRDPTSSQFVSLDGDGLAYVQITTGDTGNVRSTPIRLSVEYDAANHLTTIAIPRRGHGYEISYPSGNQ